MSTEPKKMNWLEKYHLVLIFTGTQQQLDWPEFTESATCAVVSAFWPGACPRGLGTRYKAVVTGQDRDQHYLLTATVSLFSAFHTSTTVVTDTAFPLVWSCPQLNRGGNNWGSTVAAVLSIGSELEQCILPMSWRKIKGKVFQLTQILTVGSAKSWC